MSGDIILGFVCLFAALAWDLVTDKEKFEQGQTVKHTKEWWIRVAVCIPSILFFTIAHETVDLKALLFSGLMPGFIFWILFDGLYNVWIIKFKDFWSLNMEGTAKLDRFLKKIGRTWSIILKIVLATSSIVLYFITL